MITRVASPDRNLRDIFLVYSDSHSPKHHIIILIKYIDALPFVPAQVVTKHNCQKRHYLSSGTLKYVKSGSKATDAQILVQTNQPRPQGLLLVQNGGRRNPWPRLPTWLQKFVRISSNKHDEMSSFCLNNGFRLQRTKRAARRWKQPPKKPFHQVSRDKILPDSWSISAALPGVSPTAILNEEKALG